VDQKALLVLMVRIASNNEQIHWVIRPIFDLENIINEMLLYELILMPNNRQIYVKKCYLRDIEYFYTILPE